MTSWNSRSNRSFPRRSQSARQTYAAPANPVDTWDIRNFVQADDATPQRLNYRLVTLPDNPRQLAIEMTYEDGAPVRSMPYALSESERETAALVMAVRRRHEDSLFVLEGPSGHRALSHLMQNTKVIGQHGRVLSLQPAYAGLDTWESAQDGSQTFRLVDGPDQQLLRNAGGPWIVDHDSVAPVITSLDPNLAFKLAIKPPLPAERSAQFAAEISAISPKAAPVPIRIERKEAQPSPRMVMDRDGETPVARIAAAYEGTEVHDIGKSGAVRSYDAEQGVLSIIERDAAAERRILEDARNQGLTPTADAGTYHFADNGDDLDAALYENRERERLEGQGWTMSSGAGWNITTRRISRLELNVALGKDQPGYLLDLVGDGKSVEFIDPLHDIASAIPAEADDEEAQAYLQHYVRGDSAGIRASNGNVWILPTEQFLSLVTSLRRILVAPRGPSEPMRADTYSIADLAHLSSDIGLNAGESLTRLFSMMRSGETKSIDYPACFTGDQEAKQLAAASWMRTLFEAGYGGILADDVGYGKTFEIALHIASLWEAGLLTDSALIVVPNNAVAGWLSKLTEHFAAMPIVIWHKRNRPDTKPGDIVITSHDLVKRHSCPLGHRPWTVVVLDEAQDANNPHSALAKAIAAMDAQQKIPTTATPIENKLEDLWTLMNIANQGMLGDLSAFRKVIIEPIEKDADLDAANRVNALTAPFQMMRIDTDRPKPNYHEIVVDLSEEQKVSYDLVIGLLRKRFEKRLERAQNTGVGVSQLGMSVLLSMTRARQLVCNPLLMPGGVSGPVTAYSASPKTRAIVDKACELVDEGKRIIIFSSWTGHLDLLASALHSMDVRTVSYDGRTSTKDKEAAEKSFKNHDADVILMTTKSGGRSLDFNEADAIFFADPWWNPKTEHQGVGRATRRGQTKIIDVYRFLTNSPVERRISAVARNKDQLSNLITPGRLLETCDGITMEDIGELLETFAQVSDDLRMAA